MSKTPIVKHDNHLLQQIGENQEGQEIASEECFH